MEPEVQREITFRDILKYLWTQAAAWTIYIWIRMMIQMQSPEELRQIREIYTNLEKENEEPIDEENLHG